MKMRKFSGSVLGAEASKGGLILAGMIAAKGLQKLVGQDNLVINLGTAVVGLAAASLIDNPHVQAAGHGMLLYGSIKTLGTIAKDVAPVGVNGLGFTAPEPIRKFILDYVPTLGSVSTPVFMLPQAAPSEATLLGTEFPQGASMLAGLAA